MHQFKNVHFEQTHNGFIITTQIQVFDDNMNSVGQRVDRYVNTDKPWEMLEILQHFLAIPPKPEAPVVGEPTEKATSDA